MRWAIAENLLLCGAIFFPPGLVSWNLHSYGDDCHIYLHDSVVYIFIFITIEYHLQNRINTMPHNTIYRQGIHIRQVHDNSREFCAQTQTIKAR